MSENNDKDQGTQPSSMTHDASALEQRSGPGATLKKARLERRLEVLDIAQHLHLPEAAIESLENNQYHYFPSLVFVRGHLRSYARFLNLSPDEVVAHFNQLELEVAPVKSQPQKIYVKPAYMNDKVMRVVSYAIALMVILALALWWSHHSSQEQALVSPNGDASMTLSNETSAPATDSQAVTTTDTTSAVDGQSASNLQQMIPADGAISTPATSVTTPTSTTGAAATPTPTSDAAQATNNATSPTTQSGSNNTTTTSVPEPAAASASATE